MIILTPYNPKWPQMFKQEQARLEPLLQPWLHGGIEHVGSTAIPGMVAKPVIDIMVGVESLEASKPAISLLQDSGYCYYPYKTDVMHWFCKPTSEFRTHHLHLVPYQSPLWQQRMAFLQHLRSNPTDAKAYAKVKTELAARFANDREAYTQGKWPFIKGILDKITNEKN